MVNHRLFLNRGLGNSVLGSLVVQTCKFALGVRTSEDGRTQAGDSGFGTVLPATYLVTSPSRLDSAHVNCEHVESRSTSCHSAASRRIDSL